MRTTVPIQQRYTESESVMLEGIHWRALLYLVAFPVVGAGAWIFCSEEAQQMRRDDPNLNAGIRSRLWYKEQTLERKRLRDEKRAKREEEEKMKREQELYEQEKERLLALQQQSETQSSNGDEPWLDGEGQDEGGNASGETTDKATGK